MDEQRALLDSLMGFNRNCDRDDLEVTDFRDSRVCKFYLLGMCPHEMFVNTKADCGPCEKMHSDPLKSEFERHGDPGMFDNEVERDFLQRVSDIDRTIKRSRARVEEEKVDDMITTTSSGELLALQAEIDRLAAEAETAGEEGDIDKAQELMVQVEVKNREKEEILHRASEHKKTIMARTGVDVNKKLRVCDICGSFLSILDSDKRLADHFMGKQHIGYQLMRDTLEAINTRREAKRSNPSESRDKRGGSRDRRQRSRSPVRDRGDKNRPRDRDDRDGDRGGRYRDGDRNRDRDRRDDRDRDRERDKHRDRDYRRERDYDREKRRY